MARMGCADIAVLDRQMPRLDGIKAAKQIFTLCPRTAVSAVSLHEPEQLLQSFKKPECADSSPKDDSAASSCRRLKRF